MNMKLPINRIYTESDWVFFELLFQIFPEKLEREGNGRNHRGMY